MSSPLARILAAAAVGGALALVAPPVAGTGAPARTTSENGVVAVRSIYPMAQTIARLKQDIAAKGILFFASIDQSRLAADAGMTLRPSTLLVFGNPALGAQFMTSNPLSGLDWPVRLLVTEDEQGQVWVAYTDFAYIRRRHSIPDRDSAFDTASRVIASIVASVSSR